AKMPKRTLATRSPVLGEFISRLLELRGDLSATMRLLYIALRRNDAACTNMPTIARPMNTMVEPVDGSTMALSIKYAPIKEETTISAQSNAASSRIAPMMPPTTKMMVEYCA